MALPAINSSKDPRFVDENVAEVAVQTTKQFLEQSHFVKKVIFAVNNDKERHIYQKLLNWFQSSTSKPLAIANGFFLLNNGFGNVFWADIGKVKACVYGLEFS